MMLEIRCLIAGAGAVGWLGVGRSATRSGARPAIFPTVAGGSILFPIQAQQSALQGSSHWETEGVWLLGQDAQQLEVVAL
jgi:hypothetical protein